MLCIMLLYLRKIVQLAICKDTEEKKRKVISKRMYLTKNPSNNIKSIKSPPVRG